MSSGLNQLQQRLQQAQDVVNCWIAFSNNSVLKWCSSRYKCTIREYAHWICASCVGTSMLLLLQQTDAILHGITHGLKGQLHGPLLTAELLKLWCTNIDLMHTLLQSILHWILPVAVMLARCSGSRRVCSSSWWWCNMHVVWRDGSWCRR